MHTEVVVIPKKYVFGGQERRLANFGVDKSFAPVLGIGQVHIGFIVLVVAAVIKHDVEVARNGVYGQPGEELMVASLIVVHPQGGAPGVTAVGRFGQPYIGIVGAVALVAPIDVDGAAIGALAEVGSSDGQAIGAVNAGNIESPTARLIGHYFVRSQPGFARIQRAIKINLVGVGPGHINFAVGANGGHRSFGGIVVVEAVAFQLTEAGLVAPGFAAVAGTGKEDA